MMRGWNQTEFIEALRQNGMEVGRSQVSNWELGKNRPYVDHALIIAQVLGCRVEDIWKVEKEKHP